MSRALIDLNILNIQTADNFLDVSLFHEKFNPAKLPVYSY
jgi:hypothetical protein